MKEIGEFAPNDGNPIVLIAREEVARLNFNLITDSAYLYLVEEGDVDKSINLDYRTIVDKFRGQTVGIEFSGLSRGVRTDFLSIEENMKKALEFVFIQTGININNQEN